MEAVQKAAGRQWGELAERLEQAALKGSEAPHELVCGTVLREAPTGMIVPPPEVSGLLWHGRDLLVGVGGEVQQRKGWDYSAITRTVAGAAGGGGVKVNVLHWHRRGGALLLAGDKNGVLRVHRRGGGAGGDFRLVKALQVHSQELRDVSSSPASLQKVATCSDDASCRLVDLETGQLERELLGHCSEVKTVAWHASLALLLTGSKDYTVKLWDARAGCSVATMYHHNNLVHDVKWTPFSPHCFVTASKDATMRLVDIRNLTGTLEDFRAPTAPLS